MDFIIPILIIILNASKSPMTPRLPPAVTLTPAILLLLLLYFLPLLSLSLSSTLSITSSSNTICGILADNSPQSIQCTNFTSSFPIFPNVSFRSISGSSSFFCALRSDSLTFFCYSSSSHSYSPKRVHTGPTPLSDLSTGPTQIAALTSSPTSIHFWRGASASLPPSVPGSFHSLASGNNFTCAVNSTNSVNCWGKNATAIQTAFQNETMGNIVAGDNHICGVNTAGSVVCKGSNSSGQLHAPVGPAFGFAGLALGGEHSCAIETVNNTVLCWGGKGNRIGVGYYTPLGNTSVEVIVAGGNLTCAVITANFSVVCWVSDPVRPAVRVVPLPKILPGICIREDEQISSCSCGIIADSKSLCSGSGVICKSICPPPPPPPPPPATTSPPLPSPSTSSSDKKTSNKWLAFAIVGGVGCLIGACSIVYCIWFGVCRQKKVHNSVQPTVAATNVNANVYSGNLENGPSPRISPNGSKSRVFRRNGSKSIMRRQRSGPSSFKDRTEQFTLAELVSATKSFSLENKIGAGSFGTVYKGKLPDGREVAIKRSETTPRTKKMEEKETAYQSELAFLSRLHHKHLVGFVGYCAEREERLLVYEYMKNGALYDHLHSEEHLSSPLLNSWKMRIKVLLDASRGIEYLHSYAVPPIIHRDIKSSNILLDANWVGRVSDFGLSLMEPENTTEGEQMPIGAAGTLGYMDPEYYGLHHLTVKSDVYGLGVVMLEVLTGKKAIFKEEGGNPASVVDYAVPSIVRGEIGRVLDGRVGPPADGQEAEAVELVAYTAVHCVSLEGKERPSMTDVVANLENAMSLLGGSHGSASSATISFGSYD